MNREDARARLIATAQAVSAGEFADDRHPWDQELAEEQLALAARDYANAVGDGDTKPVGWVDEGHLERHYCVPASGEPELVFFMPDYAWSVTHNRSYLPKED